jgi:branched-subunit amino acid aminotransferase/4-amino-4-deoxychorismate lyase
LLIIPFSSTIQLKCKSEKKEITPVVQIDHWTIGDGKPGPQTYELEQRFIELVERKE